MANRDRYYHLYAPPPGIGYYVPPRMVIPGKYGSSLMISIPEPDGEVMLTVLDHEGHEQADIYVDGCEFVKALTEVEEAYAAIPEEGKRVPTRPKNVMPETEGSHP